MEYVVQTNVFNAYLRLMEMKKFNVMGLFSFFFFFFLSGIKRIPRFLSRFFYS